jgi:hypothetical protein
LKAAHAERLDDPRFDLVEERLLACALGGGAEQHIGIRRVKHFVARLELQGRQAEAIERHDRIEKHHRVRVVFLGHDLRPVVRNAAHVTENMPQLDNLLALLGIIGHELADVIVEVEPVIAEEQHDEEGEDRLGVGGPVENRLRGHGQLAFAIGAAVTFEVSDLLVAENADGDADDLLFFHLRLDGRIDGGLLYGSEACSMGLGGVRQRKTDDDESGEKVERFHGLHTIGEVCQRRGEPTASPLARTE